MFKGILIEKDGNNSSAALKDIDDSLLPEGDVTVRVAFSSLNYKDCLAITGKSPVVRRFPMVPGVDLAGTVEASSNSDYQVGDSVLLNGWGVGETHWGGLAQKARIKGEWLVPLPSAFSFCLSCFAFCFARTGRRHRFLFSSSPQQTPCPGNIRSWTPYTARCFSEF